MSTPIVTKTVISVPSVGNSSKTNLSKEGIIALVVGAVVFLTLFHMNNSGNPPHYDDPYQIKWGVLIATSAIISIVIYFLMRRFG